jgi:hypothetical protein
MCIKFQLQTWKRKATWQTLVKIGWLFSDTFSVTRLHSIDDREKNANDDDEDE